MAVVRGKKTGRDTYLALVHAFPLRPIRSDAQLDAAVEMIDRLLARRSLDKAEEDYLQVLSDLVERYEAEEHPMQPLSDGEMLRHLIEAKEVTQSQLAQTTGIADSTISEVLAGKRRLTRAHIAKLAQFFSVGPAVFAFK